MNLELMGQAAQQAAFELATAATEKKNRALAVIADELEANQDVILAANAKDIAAAKEAGMTDALVDRLLLNAERLAGIANEYGLKFTIHMDAPVVYPDQMHNMWTAVNRVTRSGETLGKWHKISPYQALEAITIHSAYQNFEETEKGSIEVGKRADLVILEANPLDIDPMAIKDIKVLETIKDGNTVFTL